MRYGLLTLLLAAPQAFAAGTAFRDCADCPELVTVPAGSFVMGAAADSPDADALPPHRVSFAAPFAIGAHETTRAEFARFVAATGYDAAGGCNLLVNGAWTPTADADWRNPGYPQTDHEPVACVSWTDAQAYLQWLSAEAGVRYRLPTESEWEYVARAGTTGEYDWPEGAGHDHANYGQEGCCGGLVEGRDRFKYTSPVGSFEANAFGAYDLRGNVWEWLQDCYHENYEGAPADGSARTGGCSLADRRGVRGGSWNDGAELLRASYRLRGPLDGRYFTLGFRVGRNLGQPGDRR